MGLALGIFLLVTGLGQVLARGENRSEARNRRMRTIGQGATTAEVLELLKPANEAAAPGRLPIVGNLPAALREAGLAIAPARFLALCALAFALAFALPLAAVGAKRAKRLAAPTGQLPGALDLLARGLRVGQTLLSNSAWGRASPDLLRVTQRAGFRGCRGG